MNKKFINTIIEISLKPIKEVERLRKMYNFCVGVITPTYTVGKLTEKQKMKNIHDVLEEQDRSGNPY